MRLGNRQGAVCRNALVDRIVSQSASGDFRFDRTSRLLMPGQSGVVMLLDDGSIGMAIQSYGFLDGKGIRDSRQLCDIVMSFFHEMAHVGQFRSFKERGEAGPLAECRIVDWLSRLGNGDAYRRNETLNVMEIEARIAELVETRSFFEAILPEYDCEADVLANYNASAFGKALGEAGSLDDVVGRLRARLGFACVVNDWPVYGAYTSDVRDYMHAYLLGRTPGGEAAPASLVALYLYGDTSGRDRAKLSACVNWERVEGVQDVAVAGVDVDWTVGGQDLRQDIAATFDGGRRPALASVAGFADDAVPDGAAAAMEIEVGL